MSQNQEKSISIIHSIEQVKQMNIYEKLLYIQSKLEAKKDQTNNQLKSKYRNVDSILKNLKPLCVMYRVVFNFEENIIALGDMDFENSSNETKISEKGNRFYIRSTIILTNIDDKTEKLTNIGLSREAPFKKGVQTEMLSGMATTYARKKALEGLFLTADNDALDPDAIIDFQENLAQNKSELNELYNSLEKQINEAQTVEVLQEVFRLVKPSYLSPAEKITLETMIFNKKLALTEATE